MNNPPERSAARATSMPSTPRFDPAVGTKRENLAPTAPRSKKPRPIVGRQPL